MEYRFINNSYIPQFFDQAYDLNKVTVSTNIDSISALDTTIVQTKDMVVFDDYGLIGANTKSSGLYGFAGINLFNVVNFSASYTNMTSDASEIKSFFLFFKSKY